MRLLTKPLQRFWIALTRLIEAIISAGTKNEPAEKARKIIIVNKLSFATAALAAPIGTGFYLVMGHKSIWYPALMEAALCCTVIYLNQLKKHSAASIAILLVHCCGALYFSALLGPVINITPILVFMFGLCFLVYPQWKLRIIGISATVITVGLTEANLHFQFLPRLEMSEHSQLIMSVVSIPSFLVFVFLVFFGFYTQNTKLLQRLKLYVGYFGHELRNTVSSSTYVVAQLEEKTMSDERYRELRALVRQLRVADNQILDICDNALNIGEIEAGSERPLDLQAVALRRFFRERTFLHRKRADQKKMKLSLTIDRSLPEAVALDPGLMSQVLNNLITNAIKYGDHETTINVTVEGLPTGQLEITVANNCPDIDPTGLFDMYVTAKRDSSVQGSGLGLYIIKNLVGQMGGTISVASAGHITKFAVTVPVSEAQIADTAQPLYSNIGPGKCAMVVDDNYMAACQQKLVLESAGWEVLIAGNAMEMFQILGAGALLPDIILLDLNMPGLNGEQALKLLKGDDQTREIPVIICTGSMEDNAGLRARIISAGASDMQQKPLSRQNLMEIITQYEH